MGSLCNGILLVGRKSVLQKACALRKALRYAWITSSLVGMRSVAWRSGLFSSPAGCPTARMFTGTKVSGSPNSSRMTVGRSGRSRRFPGPSRWRPASCVGEDGRVHMDGAHAVERTLPRLLAVGAHDECERRVEHVRGFRQAGEPFLAGHLEDAHRLAVRGGRRDAGRFDDGVDVLLADGDAGRRGSSSAFWRDRETTWVLLSLRRATVRSSSILLFGFCGASRYFFGIYYPKRKYWTEEAAHENLSRRVPLPGRGNHRHRGRQAQGAHPVAPEQGRRAAFRRAATPHVAGHAQDAHPAAARAGGRRHGASRAVHQVPPKTEYSLTQRGVSFVPVLNAMCAWGKDVLDEVGKPSPETSEVLAG